MQFPESWLREFCDPPLSSAELADLLTMSGMEVEERRPVAPPFSGVVVGDVVSVEPHPNADRLSVCLVDVGAGRDLRIVCGAPNVRAGIKVPCARVGALLPPAVDAPNGTAPFEIRLGKLRGVESEGMLCSGRELRLSDDHGGLLILGDSAPVGTDIRALLSLDDTLFTLKLTPNLGHALSVYGIAREVAALTGAPLATSEGPRVEARHRDKLKVVVEAADLCGRFSGRIIRGVDPAAPTPSWMAERLIRCGQRPVSVLVDISNYVMFELGQPSHIFDLDRIDGGLTVRWGRAGETLKLLNGSTALVDASVGVISDDAAVESLAGIMGGEATAVSDATRNVYVEAAFWWPDAVAGRSRRFNFSTEAGHRFERGVDPATTASRLERISALILAICGGEAGPVDDRTLSLPQRRPVRLRVARAQKVIGMPIRQDECGAVMRRLGLEYEEAPGELRVTPPSWRFDLQIEEDLIEEVIRVLGFDRLPSTPPVAPVTALARSESRVSSHRVRRRMADLGYHETINFSFVETRWENELAGNADPIRVVNPIAAPLAVMRSSLVGSLIQVLRTNLARKGRRVRVFEIGRVFRRDAATADGTSTVGGVDQPMRLAGLAQGAASALQWGEKERAVDFYDVKGDVEALLSPQRVEFVAAEHPALHPGRSAQIVAAGVPIGYIGELHPRWRQAYELPTAPLLFEIELDALLVRALPRHQPIARQQSAWRDVALMADERVTYAELLKAIENTPTPLLRSAQLFDVYRPVAPAAGASERSLAVRLELLDDEATLTDERIDAVVAEVLDHLALRLGVRLRG